MAFLLSESLQKLLKFHLHWQKVCSFGRNPTWRLSSLQGCPSSLLVPRGSWIIFNPVEVLRAVAHAGQGQSRGCGWGAAALGPSTRAQPPEMVMG